MDFLILFWELVTTEDRFVIITKNWPQSNLQRQYQQYQWRNLAPKDIPHILPPISTSKVKNEALPDPCHPHLTRLCLSSNYNCIFRKQQMTQERCRLFCLPKYTQFDDGISKYIKRLSLIEAPGQYISSDTVQVSGVPIIDNYYNFIDH